VLEDPLVLKISKAHAKTPAQILLRHLIQQNIAVIPKSASPRRIKENFEVRTFRAKHTKTFQMKPVGIDANHHHFCYPVQALNFELSDREIEQLNNLDNDFRSFKFDFFPW